uniref:NADH dehydrogenase subunit 6 n=1 Tax=Desis jiaxiangi TaxID=2789892 RepID=A0A8B0Z2Z8_9ARAC|nr:NADH dehydrogenase subunit 6 [Desis jiaxiangi]QTX95134.1 NADH dehydrogenase subunit 6 [Desis jiaxiangi]
MVMIVLGGFFLISIQPMFMIISLIFITLVYSIWIYQIMSTYWFSYALVMVMLSGILVLFMYMISLIPNESFEIYNLIIIFFFLMWGLNVGFEEFKIDNSFICMNLWMNYVGIFNLFLVSFLLSIMIMVVWLSWCSKGTLRI